MSPCYRESHAAAAPNSDPLGVLYWMRAPHGHVQRVRAQGRAADTQQQDVVNRLAHVAGEFVDGLRRRALLGQSGKSHFARFHSGAEGVNRGGSAFAVQVSRGEALISSCANQDQMALVRWSRTNPDVDRKDERGSPIAKSA